MTLPHYTQRTPPMPKGVMFNAYPDSIGQKLGDTVSVLSRPELRDSFSLFYILPTFFNSDLDRGFSVVDYEPNEELVSEADLQALDDLGINLKFDLVLNHLSVGSPQFQDLVERGDDSPYRDFFIDWNDFWKGEGEVGLQGYLVPKQEHLDRLFMRKPGLPILNVRFPDGTERPYWNTFYQQIQYDEIQPEDFEEVEGVSREQAAWLADAINQRLQTQTDWREVELNGLASRRAQLFAQVEKKRRYLGQMDLNAGSEQVWSFYGKTLERLRRFGAKMVRLDAFAYLHKQPGRPNFFNKPETWDYLHRLRELADVHDLILLPEIHGEYGRGLHEEVAAEGFPIYDFFLPGLIIDALDRGTSGHLVRWMRELVAKDIRTINMLGCHDGIPVLDLAGKQVDGTWHQGLLDDEAIEQVIHRVMDRGGRVKNLYGADGRKIAYYQVNATFFSALGEDEAKMRLARAIQLFTPGIPQVWYLDLFAGTNDYSAADRGGPAGHKEINRTTLDLATIEERLHWPVVRDQIELIRLRNTSPAFDGTVQIEAGEDHRLNVTWVNGEHIATLQADLRDSSFEVRVVDPTGLTALIAYP